MVSFLRMQTKQRIAYIHPITWRRSQRRSTLDLNMTVSVTLLKVLCVVSTKMSLEHRAQETGFFLELILISIVWGLKPRARCKLFQQRYL